MSSKESSIKKKSKGEEGLAVPKKKSKLSKIPSVTITGPNPDSPGGEVKVSETAGETNQNVDTKPKADAKHKVDPKHKAESKQKVEKSFTSVKNAPQNDGRKQSTAEDTLETLHPPKKSSLGPNKSPSASKIKRESLKVTSSASKIKRESLKVTSSASKIKRESLKLTPSAAKIKRESLTVADPIPEDGISEKKPSITETEPPPPPKEPPKSIAIDAKVEELKSIMNSIRQTIRQTPCEFQGLMEIHARNPQRSLEFLEEVRASRKMKQLTKKFGSKGKPAKEYFMEAYDADTMIEFPDEGAEDGAKGPARIFNWKGEEIKQTDDTTRTVKQTESDTFLDDDFVENQEDELELSRLASPIVFRSLEALLDSAPTGLKPDLSEENSEANFWAELERIEREQKGEKTPSDTVLSCESLGSSWSGSSRSSNEELGAEGEEEVEQEEVPEEPTELVEEEPFDFDHTKLDKYLDRNVQQVIQSEAIKREWDLVKQHLEDFDVKDPHAFDMFSNLYEEVCDFVRLPEEDVLEFQAGNWEPPLLNEEEIFEKECPEKLMGRFKVFQKGLMFMAEHFETLRPLLAEIRQSYEEVMERCEREHKDLDKMRLEQLRIKMTYAEHVRATDKIGDGALKESKIQANVLQQHIQCQQHTVDTMMGMLWKMRQSLKMQTHLAKKTKVDYKNKVETLSREIVNQSGQANFEMTLPGKYTEIMERFKQIKDPKQVRQILQAARRVLKKTHKQIVIFEADYADTVPRPEYELYLKKYNSLHARNATIASKNKQIQDEKDQIKERIRAMRAKIYQEVGLDESTGEKPILYLETLGKGPEVPIYLRYDKPIVDMKYSVEESATIIREIWVVRSQLMALCRKIKKARDDEQEGFANFPDDLPYDIPDIIPFANFVAEFLLNKAENEDLAMQMAYNVVASCRRNTRNYELTLFLRCLEGTQDESVYHLCSMEAARIQDFIAGVANWNKEARGSLTLADFTKALKDACPDYREEELNDLVDAAKSHVGSRGEATAIPITKYFERTDTLGRANAFIDLLAQQIEALRREFVNQIQNEILLELGISEKLLEAVDDPAWLTDVPMSGFYGAVHSVDPEIDDITLSRYVAWVYLGVTLYPGISPVGTKLVEFIREKLRAPDYDPDKYNEDDDMEFEDCVRQLREYEEDDATMDKLEIKKRRLQTKKLKNASLRQVSDRLFAGPFVRCGKRPEPNALVSTISEVEEVEVEEEAKETRRHRHRHRHRGSEEEERSHRRRRDKESRRKKSELNDVDVDVD